MSVLHRTGSYIHLHSHKMKREQPRGIRNNNPLNIRIGNTWLGERDNPSDPEFEEFTSIELGYRAAFCILRRYIRRYKKNTVASIISTWAPASENATQKYIDYVCAQMHRAPDQIIDYFDADTMIDLVRSMHQFECGVPADIKKVAKGYYLA